jgi:hypothetical protein
MCLRLRVIFCCFLSGKEITYLSTLCSSFSFCSSSLICFTLLFSLCCFGFLSFCFGFIGFSCFLLSFVRSLFSLLLLNCSIRSVVALSSCVTLNHVSPPGPLHTPSYLSISNFHLIHKQNWRNTRKESGCIVHPTQKAISFRLL